MIKFEEVEVFNFKGAIRGMRNALESWGKSDSFYHASIGAFIVGENDYKLMAKLVKAGSDHSKFMRQILVSVDIIAPDYWFAQFDTYKIGTVANSTSTMHKIMSREFNEDMFSWEHASAQYKVETLDKLNSLRTEYLKTKDKDVWYELIQQLPRSYNYRRTVTLNYEVLRNMYHSRQLHKLDEWSVGFVDFVNTLPHRSLITMDRR